MIGKIGVLGILAAALFSAGARAEVKSQAEAGVVSTTGNSRSQSYSVKDKTTLLGGPDSYVFEAHYLDSSANGVPSARNWLVGLRYEHAFSDFFSAFLSEQLEGDEFAGYLQRYNTDLGPKYYFAKREKDLIFFAEAGYRFTHENDVTGATQDLQKARLYSEAEKYWSPTFSTKLWVEYVPNFTVSENWLLNSAVSASAALNAVFALQVSYLLRYNNLPPVAAALKTDTTLTTALAAKF
jgi:putative salt-induced outer membrane protein YdiY